MELVRDAEHWAQLLDNNAEKLIVVDVHKQWCGPCKIMEPTYKRLISDIDNAERRIMFATLNVDLHVNGVEDNDSCKPRFLLIKNRKQIASVDGANAPQLEQLVKEYLPPSSQDD